MKISTAPGTNSTSFKGVNIGKTKSMIGDIPAEIKLYRIEPQDYSFLKDMRSNIRMRELLPEMSVKKNFSEWKGIIDHAVNDIIAGKKGILAAINDKPCAIASIGQTTGGSVYVYNLSSWPVAPDTRVKDAGKSVMRQIYYDALKDKNRMVSLTPLLDGPTDTLKFYRSMGFELRNPLEGEWAASHRAIDIYSDLMDDFLHYEPVKDAKSEKFSKFMKIDYLPWQAKHETIQERLLNFFKEIWAR